LNGDVRRGPAVDVSDLNFQASGLFTRPHSRGQAILIKHLDGHGLFTGHPEQGHDSGGPPPARRLEMWLGGDDERQEEKDPSGEVRLSLRS
jgi:hypothetical protein